MKPVQKNLALLFLLLNAAGVAVQCLNLLSLFAPMLISGSADFQKAFQPNQIEALNLLFLNLHKSGFTIDQIFFGTWLFPLGYLVYKSEFLPKWLGMLLMADSVTLVIAILLIDVPMLLQEPSTSLYFFLIGLLFNTVRFLFLGIAIGYLYKRLD